MNPAKVGVLIAFIITLGVPFVFAMTREDGQVVPGDALRLVVITPHNEQIRYEFERAFDQWHRQNYELPVDIDWRAPGGTSTIRRQLESEYIKALTIGKITPKGQLARDDQGNPTQGTMGADIFFGGGSYDHGQVKRGITANVNGDSVSLPIAQEIEFPQEFLDDIYGENVIGSGELYDPEGYWHGTALSGFGILFNRDVLQDLGLPEPTTWDDLRDPRYQGWIGLADPRASGSVTTTYDSILNNYGWEEGWAILRDMSANARYFSNSSSKVPLDVSQGEAAAGVAIDFYGRYQAQAVTEQGQTAEQARLGYIDPPGVVFIDADPITLLRGGPNPELAMRFIEFTLTERAQAIWQYPATTRAPAPDGLGPERYELRRMPVRRVMYQSQYSQHFIDKANPFQLASNVQSKGWRSAVAPMMAAFSIEIHAEQVAAWEALAKLRNAHAQGAIEQSTLSEAEQAFYAFPTHTFPDPFNNDEGQPITDRDGNPLAGKTLLFSPENYRTIRNDWPNRTPTIQGRTQYLTFFRDQYKLVRNIAERAGL